MRLKSFPLAGVFATAVLTGQASAAEISTKAPPVAQAAPFFIVSDTQIQYWHEFNAAEPGVGRGIDKDIVTVQHFDVWQYGTNFVNIDFLKSDNHDPAAPWGGLGYPIPPGGIGDGAFEVYGLFRSTLSWNSMFGTKAFTEGPLKDISFFFGADANTKNTAFAPQKRDVVAGLQFAFDLPFGGYFNVAPNYYKEWNHNGIAAQTIAAGICSPLVCTENVKFDSTFKLENVYLLPFGSLPVRFSGYTHVTAPKGTDGFGNKTKTEIHTDNRLTLDLGKATGYTPNWIDVFVGYSYWQNKFGSDHKTDATGGSTESAVYLGMAWHWL